MVGEQLWQSIKVFAIAGMLGLSCESRATALTLPYQRPPRIISDSLTTTDYTAFVSPDRGWAILGRRAGLPDIGTMSTPLISVGRWRISPKTWGWPTVFPLALAGMDVARLSDGSRRHVSVPSGELGAPLWSPDSSRFVFWRSTRIGFELWEGSATTQKVRRLVGPQLNVVESVEQVPCNWAGSRALVCELRQGHALSPKQGTSVLDIEQSDGDAAGGDAGTGPLKTPDDVRFYEHYRSSQAVLIDGDSGRMIAVGKPAIYADLNPSPDGRYLLTVKIRRPYSDVVGEAFFGKQVDVTDLKSGEVTPISTLPMGWPATPLPSFAQRIHLPVTPKRGFVWRPDVASTLIYTETTGGGNEASTTESGEQVMMLKAPFHNAPAVLFSTAGHVVSRSLPQPYRSPGDVYWGKNGVALIKTSAPVALSKAGKIQWWKIDVNALSGAPRLVGESASVDSFASSGEPMTLSMGRQERLLVQDGEFIYFQGLETASQGSRVVVKRLNLQTLQSEKIFSARDGYDEKPLSVGRGGAAMVLQSQSPNDPPSVLMRDMDFSKEVVVMPATDIPSELKDIKRQIIHYTRADGIELSGTLYLPAGYKYDHALPTVIYAYPLDFPDRASFANTATYQADPVYPWIEWPNEPLAVRLLVTQGYAVLDNAGMPVIGGYDAAASQMVMNAQAAVDELVKEGVAERSKIGLAGHSFGGAMTATVMSHSAIVAAGVAMDGGYNWQVTAPFGFQNERRWFWQAPESYRQLSAFGNADKISAPLLIIHGAEDPRAPPDDARRMYQALAGLGKKVRLVVFPFEGHAPKSKQASVHQAWEVLNWFDRFLKDKPQVQ